MHACPGLPRSISAIIGASFIKYRWCAANGIRGVGMWKAMSVVYPSETPPEMWSATKLFTQSQSRLKTTDAASPFLLRYSRGQTDQY